MGTHLQSPLLRSTLADHGPRRKPSLGRPGPFEDATRPAHPWEGGGRCHRGTWWACPGQAPSGQGSCSAHETVSWQIRQTTENPRGGSPCKSSHGGSPCKSSHCGSPCKSSHCGSPCKGSHGSSPCKGSHGGSPCKSSHGGSPCKSSHGSSPCKSSHGSSPCKSSHGGGPSAGFPGGRLGATFACTRGSSCGRKTRNASLLPSRSRAAFPARVRGPCWRGTRCGGLPWPLDAWGATAAFHRVPGVSGPGGPATTIRRRL
jgi:hypothetical protein